MPNRMQEHAVIFVLHVINISLTVKKNKLTFLAYVYLVVPLKMKESHLHGFEVWPFKTVLHS